eukprot:scaffold60472_cov58-Phaeocystis_antarctica.AAC.1
MYSSTCSATPLGRAALRLKPLPDARPHLLVRASRLRRCWGQSACFSKTAGLCSPRAAAAWSSSPSLPLFPPSCHSREFLPPSGTSTWRVRH